MSGVNKVILIGRLGSDPEFKVHEKGNICKFPLATSEVWGKGEDRKEKTEWHKIVIFGKLADVCGEYLKKGRQAYIEGRIQTRKYEKDGETKYMTEVIGNNVQFLGGGSGGAAGSNPQTDQGDAPPGFDDGEQIPL